MPRRKRHEKISEYHLQNLDRAVSGLRFAMSGANLDLAPFEPHYEALSELDRALTRCLNVLCDRPADYVEPYRGPAAGLVEAQLKNQKS